MLLQMTKVSKVELRPVVSGRKDIKVHSSWENLILLKSKINSEIVKIRWGKDSKDQLCKKNLRLDVCKNIDLNKLLTQKQLEANKKKEEFEFAEFWKLRNEELAIAEQQEREEER